MIITPANKKKKKNEEIAPTKIITKETKEKAVEALNNSTNQAIDKVKAIWGNGYQVGDVTKTLLTARDTARALNPVDKAVNQTVDFTKTMIKDIKEGRASDYIKSGKPGKEIAKTWDNGYQFGDVTKTLLNADKLVVGTGADVLANLAKGELQTAEGLVDTGRYLTSDIASVLGAKKYSEGVRQRAIQNTTGAIFGENDAYNNPTDNGWLKKLDEYSVLGRRLDNMVQSVGQQAFRVGLQEGVGSAAGKLGATASQTAKAQQAFNNMEIWLGAYGSAKSDALANGADYGTASLRGVISGTAEYISEHLDEGLFVKTGSVIGGVKSGIASGVEKAFNSKLMGKIALGAISGYSEGLEERLSNTLETVGTDFVNYINANYTYGMQEGQGLDKNTALFKWQNVKKLWDDARASYSSAESDEAAEAALWSTIFTFGLAEANTNINKNQAIKAVAQENHISEEAAAKIYEAVVEARTADLKTKDTRYDDLYNIRNQVSNELSQGVKEGNLNLVELNKGYIAKDLVMQAARVKNSNNEYVNSTDGLNLVDSYKAYRGDDGNLQNVKTVQAMYDNKGIESRVDGTYFKNNSDQTSLWTIENGKEKVIINPRANANEIFQDAAIHELSHSLFNQNKTLMNDIIEHAQQKDNYKDFRKGIEEAYKDTYKNRDNFDELIDEEVAVKYLGENLGTQEYINRLVGEKPSTARRIYDWIVDKIDNIGQTEEYKQEKKYWKDIADKFEKAYENHQAIINEDTVATEDSRYMKRQLAKSSDLSYNMFNDKSTSDYIKEDIRKADYVKYGNEKTFFAEDLEVMEEIAAKTNDEIAKIQTDKDKKSVRFETEINANNGTYVIEANALKDNQQFNITYVERIDSLVEEVANETNPSRNSKYNLENTKYGQSISDANLESIENRTTSERIQEIFGEKQKQQQINGDRKFNKSIQENSKAVKNTAFSLSEVDDYVNQNNYKFNSNGILTVSNLTDKQIKDLVKIYHATGYEDVSTDYLTNRLKEGNFPLQREIADRFIEKELGHKPVIDKTQIYEDAEGNPLTQEQVEFYKDSDVRDIRGRLIPVYHRTNADFTIFDAKAGKQHGNKYGKGFYFSITPENFGNNTMKVYLNASDGNFKYIPKMGYYVVQDSNQIKNVDNKAPTSNPDIRYSISSNYRGSHQIENAKSITELNLDDVKSKIIEVDGYLTNQAQSDYNKLQKILNNPDAKVKIYRAAPVNELNSGDWVTTDKSYAQNVADNNGGKVYTYEVNANELYYPDNVRDLPSLHRLSSFQYVENQTATDNQGNEVNKSIQEYMKDSYARVDENVNNPLVMVYHTTTDYTNQFNEFNPVGTPGYKYGDITVNFFTDSEDMSSSYGHNIIKPNTKRIQNMQEVYELLGNRYKIKEINGKYELYDNYDEQKLNNYKELIKIFNQQEQNILNKTFNKTRSEVIEMLNDEQFELYNKTRTKFLDMLSAFNDAKGVQYDANGKTIDELVDNYLNNKGIEPRRIFNNKEDLFRNITEATSPYEHYQYNGYLNITNPYIVDGENKNWNNITRGTSAENEKIYNSLTLKEKNYLSNLADKMDNMYQDYEDSVEGFYQRVNAYDEKLYDKITQNASIRQKLYDTALYQWNDTYVKDLIGERETTNDIVKQVIDMNKNGANYDGVIIKNIKDYGANSNNLNMDKANNVYVTFNSNQFKAVDNLNPTDDPDIRYATQAENEIAPVTKGTRTTFGELFPETVAPIREDISKISKQVENLSKQIETLQNEAKNTTRNNNKGYVETYKEQRYENQDYAPLNQADAELYQNALMSDEGYVNSLEAEANNINDTLINTITNNVQNQLGLSKNQKATLENIVRESIENDYSTDEISQRLEQEFKNQEYKLTNEEAKSVKKLIKLNPIKVSDGIKKDIADYNDFQRKNLNKITFSRNGVPVDIAYKVLNEQAPGYFPSDIINPTDQLLKISDVANMANETIEKVEISSDVFDNMADYITNSILEERYNNQVDSQASLSKDIQFNMTDDILPTTIRSQEAIDEYIDERDIAPVREETPFARKQVAAKEKINNTRKNAQEMFINRNYIIDETAKATGNNEIKFAGDNLNSVSGEAQFNINNHQTDMNGNWIGKSVHEIFQPARDAGLYAAFNDYLIQKSNIERHNVGKGSRVPLAVSQQLVARYELENPQFKTWAKDVYKYFDNVLQEQLDSGLITKEQYDNFRGEHGIYRSYVPFYEADMESNRYFDNEGNLKAVSTLKRAKGNATDVNQMLSVEDSMARQTYAYKRAIRQNELYKQIVSSSERFNEMMDQDVRTNPTNLDDSLYITNEGDKVLTAYINGEKVSAIISDELFNELSGENEARIRQIEEDFSLITNPLQKVSNVRRNLLTSWNPTFLARNAIKDIQDAVINSKHTADMLANYFGTKSGQKSAIMELRDAKTQESQQFLALYGADNLYGNYENVGKSNNLVNKFARINELIELAPRYAEFKASLQNGDSIQEAIYNAREVTTNFGRGGYITKALNRNGFTFLNANVQGLNKLVRNLSGENGVKGVTSVIAKGAAFAVLPSILNHLMYGSGDDKDEEYEALPDYIKDNYYLVKLTNGNFLRIPKGRINSVFGSLARRTIEAIEGEENAYEGYGKNAWSQIGIGDLGENNIFAPLIQAKNNKAWYGGDIVPTRLQNLPAGEQSDEKTDALSKFVGETLNISPKKINYVLDQYSGGLGDVLLPMMTPATTSGADNPIEYLTAPIKDSFVVNSIDDNKYAGDFYDTKEKLQIKSNSQYATDEDKLRYKYMSNISSRMSELYAERREVQADTKLSKSEKYAKVQAIQNEINNLAKEALSNYNDFSKTDSYVEIGDVEYYKDTKGEWTKVNDSDAEFTAGMTDTEKTSYYNVKNKISTINSEYNNNVDETTDDATKKKYQSKKKEDITQAIINSGLDNYTKAMIYSKHYSNANTMNNVVNSGYDVDTYITALYDIEEIRNKYSQANGYTTEQRKQKTIAYINSLNMNIPQKAMLIRNYYSSFRTYNKDIVNYVNNLDITREEKVSILQDTGMTVNGNNVGWK